VLIFFLWRFMLKAGLQQEGFTLLGFEVFDDCAASEIITISAVVVFNLVLGVGIYYGEMEGAEG